MAQNATLLDRPYRPRGSLNSASALGTGRERSAPVHLFLPLDAIFLRTPFRAKVLELIHDIARRELGDRIASVVVQASADPDDPGQMRLLLSIWADVDRHQWHVADKAISKAMFEQESHWTEGERADYLKMIDFEVVPLKI